MESPSEMDSFSYSSDRPSFLIGSVTPSKASRIMNKSNRDKNDEYTVNMNLSVFAASAVTGYDPFKEVTMNAHREFGEILDTKGTSNNLDVAQLLDSYILKCQDFVERLSQCKSSSRGVAFTKKQDITDIFRSEEQSWMLLQALRTANFVDEDILEDSKRNHNPSDAEEIDFLFDKSVDMRRAQTIIDWLERRYAYENNLHSTTNLNSFKEGGGIFDNTYRRLMNDYAGNGMITEFDPDAPIRQQKKIDDQDTEDEQRLFHAVFDLIRGGLVDKAQKLAIDQGYSHLAIGLEGWRAYCDDRRDEGTGDIIVSQGNPYRDVWKNVAWSMLKDPRVSHLEKAIYGVFCGHLESMLAACTTWEDYLWAHLHVFVDVGTETELRSTRGSTLCPLPDNYPKQRATMADIIETLEAIPELECNTFFRRIHQHFMLENGVELVNYMYERCREIDDGSDYTAMNIQQLRFMSDLALFIRHQGAEIELDKIDHIVACYVYRLVDEKLCDVVPKYVLHLPDSLRQSCYMRLLRTMKFISDKERLEIISSARDSGINIYSILKVFVYQTIQTFDLQLERGDNNEVDESDKNKIDAIQWLFVEPDQQFVGLEYANCALRQMVLRQRIQSCEELCAIIPKDATTKNFADSDNIAAIVKEYSCFEEYLTSYRTFNRWFRHYHSEKPHEPTPPGDNSALAEMLNYDLKRKAFEHQREVYESTLESLCSLCCGHLRNILNFRDGGFMKDPTTDLSDDAECEVFSKFATRVKDLQDIRKLCIPQITSMYHTVLHGTRKYKEAVEIANLIAGDHLKLYEEFSQSDLSALLKKIQESSVQLIQSPGLDPFGYVPA